MNSHLSGDIIVVRYEAGANGYRILPITEEEFSIMMMAAEGSPSKTRVTKKVFSKQHHLRPQPIFPKSKKESRSPTLNESRKDEKVHPKSSIPATNVETSKKQESLVNSAGALKEESSRKKSSTLEGKASPIVPAFLRPKVGNYQKCRLCCCCVAMVIMLVHTQPTYSLT